MSRHWCKTCQRFYSDKNGPHKHKPLKPFQRKPDPTPEEIEERKAEVQAGWDEFTRTIRAGIQHVIIKEGDESRISTVDFKTYKGIRW